MNKLKFTNSCQFDRLVKEMEKNPSLSRGFGRGRVSYSFHKQWEIIATILNSLGPPIRTGDGWRKLWNSLKSKVRRKIATNKAECKEAKLRPLDQAVANLLQFDRALNQERMVQGTPNIEDRAGCSPLSLLQRNKSSTTISKTVVPSSASSISATSTSLSSAVSASSANQIKRVNIRKNMTTVRRRCNIDRAALVTIISNTMAEIERSQQEETWPRNRNGSE